MAMLSNILTQKANRCIRLFLLAAIIFSVQSANAQSGADKKNKIAYSHFLNFQLDSCRRSIAEVSPSPWSFYQELLVISTRLFIADDSDYYKSSKHIESDLLDKLKGLNFADDYKNFLRSEIKLHWAILKLKNDEEFASFWSLKQAYNIAKENVELYPNFLPSYKTLGLLHVLYSASPDKYDWILALFGIEGNTSAGLAELDKVYISHSPYALESGLMLALLNTYILNSPKLGTEIMANVYGENRYLLVEYAYALILMKNAQSEKALNIILEAEHSHPQPFVLPQMYYLKGEILLQKNLLEESIENYKLFLSHQKGKNLVKDANYKIGICKLMQGYPDKANNYFDASQKNGWAKNEADKNALKMLEASSFSPNELYQLRYAIDGGFYNKAKIIIENIDASKLDDHDKCEFYYRSARYYHKTNNNTAAIKRYEKTIKLQKQNNWYFAPNSALQLGLIYLSENKKELAKKYLKLANEYSDYPYQNSIRQKVKVALKELN